MVFVRASHNLQYDEDAALQVRNLQRLSDEPASNINITNISNSPNPTNESRSSAAAPGHPPTPQQKTMHNTVGDEGWVPDSEEIDEEFWEETMNKPWASAGDDQSNLEVGRPGDNEAGEDTAPQDVQAASFNPLVPAPQVEAPGLSSGENYASRDPLFEDLFGAEDNVEPARPAVQLEPIQPGSEQLQFSRNPDYDPFAPEDDHLVPTQEAQPAFRQDQFLADPLFDELFADLVPGLTPETSQEIVASLGLSGNLADYRSPWLDQGVPEEPPTQTETAQTGSKRRTTDQESNNGSKKPRLQQAPTDYTPYQPRQDKRRVPMQRPQTRPNYQLYPGYVSSGPPAHLAKGSLPAPTATPEKPPTPRSSTLIPPPRRQPLPTDQPSQPPPPHYTQHHGPRATPSNTPVAQPKPYKPPRHQKLPPYHSQIPPLPASYNIPPIPNPTLPTTAPTNTPHPPTIQPAPPPQSQPPPAAAQIDHRYTAPTNADQMALVLTLLEPTIIQFRDLMQCSPFADHVVDADLAASYMEQYQHIGRELEVLWGRMNWDRSALPRLRLEGPISGARWEGR